VGVIHPNAYPGQPGQDALSQIKRMRGPLILEEGGRPPVNLNAAPRPVLIALIQDLAGQGWQNEMYPLSYTLPQPMDAAIADALILRRAAAPFRTWGEFSAFCDSLVPGVINGMNTGQHGGGNLCGADLLKANFDPNTRLAKELPDQLLWRWIDKSDLTAWSTEGDLAPTGCFRISCAGRILGPEGRLLAEASRTATVEAFSLLRQTSQKEFVDGRNPPSSYLSLSTDSLLPTNGGLALATYPCHALALPAKAADFDGRIGLATTEMFPHDPDGGTLLFLQHFDEGWDAEVGNPKARQPCTTPASDPFLQTATSESVWPAPRTEPGTLYPDGAHVQNDRSPAYSVAGNFPPSSTDPPSNRAALSYWVKPLAKKDPIEMEDTPALLDLTCSRAGQGLVIGRNKGGGHWGLVVENYNLGSDIGHERQSKFPHPFLQPGLRWRLVSACFDTSQDPNLDISFRSWWAGGTLTGVPSYVKYDHAVSTDLTALGSVFVLGSQDISAYTTFGKHTGSILDEFAVSDFGPTAVSALALNDAWALSRFQEGRYYKQGDAAFLSGALAPVSGSGVHLLQARWTAYLPSENRLELPQPGDTVLPSGQPRFLDPVLAQASVRVVLADGAGTDLKPLAQGAGIGLVLPAFRYRILLDANPVDPLTGTSDRLNQPVLETPFFDDITFAWQPMTGPRVRSWE
jgi:hypothetical protein